MGTPPALKLRRLVIAGSLMALVFPAGAWAQAYPFGQRAGSGLAVVPVKTSPAMPAKSNPVPAPVKLNPAPVSPPPVPALVPQIQAEDWCNRKNGASAEQQIQGCTALIEANRLTAKQRANAFRLRGNGYYDKKQYDVALRDYDRSIALDASAPVAYWNRGNALSMQGQYDRAIRDYDQAIRLKPSFAPAFFSRALAYQNKAVWDFDAYVNEGRYEELAVRDYSESIRLNPKGSGAYNNRGNIYLAQKDYRKAVADYDEAIRIDPKSALYLRNRANAYRAMQQYDRAIADYRKALTLNVNEPLRKAIVQALADLGVKA